MSKDYALALLSDLIYFYEELSENADSEKLRQKRLKEYEQAEKYIIDHLS